MPITILKINQREVIVDTNQLDTLKKFSWYIDGHDYAYTLLGTKMLHMHRLLCPMGDVVDHINRNPLDNRLSNLRPATRSENAINRGKTKANTSGYKGVALNKQTGKYKAAIRVNYELIHLGTYKTKEDAALAYNKAALKYFGEFAYLNVITNQEVQ